MYSLITYSLLLIPFSSFSQTEYEPPVLTCVRNIVPPASPTATELNWTLPATPNPCFTGYEIYVATGNRNQPLTSFTLDTVVTNPAATSVQIGPPFSGDTNTINYFYILNRGSCANPTPPAQKNSDTLNNQRPQPVVFMDSAIVSDRQVLLKWLAGGPEVAGYVVGWIGYPERDTIFGRFNTTFLDTTGNRQNYVIKSFEYCENITTPYAGSQDSFQTTKMNVTVDSCERAANVQWTEYTVGRARPLSYEVQTNVNGAGYSTVATIDSTKFFYQLRDLQYNTNVCVRVIVHLSTGLTSVTDDSCFSPRVEAPPKFDYIRLVSVEDGKIYVEYKKDTLATPPPSNRHPILYRSSDGILFDPLVLDPVYEDAYTIIYNDPVDPAHPYFYYVRSNDLCPGKDPHFSDTAATLFIGVKTKSNNRADITWTGFDMSDMTFDHYRLEKIRGTDTIFLGNFSRTDSKFRDTALFDYAIDTAGVCYRITAVFVNNKDAAPRQTLESHSNIVCELPEPQAFVPQAFAPRGYNKTLKANLIFSVPDNYDFRIFDRGYHLMFMTNDVNGSWDGTYNGNPAQQDGYIYIVKFTGKNGQSYTQTGTVMLIR